MLWMVQKGFTDGLWHSVNRYANADNRYIKDYDKTKELSYLKYWDINNLYGWEMSEKLPVSGLKWVEGTSQFNLDFKNSYNEKNDEV